MYAHTHKSFHKFTLSEQLTHLWEVAKHSLTFLCSTVVLPGLEAGESHPCKWKSLEMPQPSSDPLRVCITIISGTGAPAAANQWRLTRLAASLSAGSPALPWPGQKPHLSLYPYLPPHPSHQ